MNLTSRRLLFLFLLCAHWIMAQTSGPSTPEVQRFAPSGVSQMVNLFTGDLNYNIDLLELDGGYPLNLSYNSNIRMQDEAGSTGFGWQLNVGRISRTVRGLPDDFKGDEIVKRMHQVSEVNIGLGGGVDGEFFGLPFRTGVSGGILFSNLRGVDFEANVSLSKATKGSPLELSGGLSIGASSKEGSSISPNVGLRFHGVKLALNSKFTSMEGMKSLALSAGVRGIPDGNFPLSTARNPFTPRIDFPTKNIAGNLKFRFGSEAWGASYGGMAYGQFSVQSYPVNQRTLHGYGYLFLQDYGNNESLMDLATEKETPVFTEDRNMYLGYLASDHFSVSAQGLSGMFRPFRTDIGIAHHENIRTIDHATSVGAEIHAGGYAHTGVDVTPSFTENYSGEWMYNDMHRIIGFKQPDQAPVYFKEVGETNGLVSSNQFNALGGTNPVRFRIDESQIFNDLGGRALSAADGVKSSEPQNTSFMYLTAEETQSSYPGRPIQSYRRGAPAEAFEYNSGYRKPHHMAMIKVTKDDGTIYEFGIAAYNTIQKEVIFNIEESKSLPEQFNKHAGYNPGDNSEGNNRGKVNYFSSTETPPYAYAWLLTAVYSPDYSDLTGDGPTSDDFGNYTLFNYTKDMQKWRTPFQKLTVNRQPGNLSESNDDTGSYIYGEKEVWTIHSVETKNYIADFYTSERADGIESAGEDGGPGKEHLKRIDSIRLVSRIDYELNKDNAVAIKKIYFDYNYSLCPGLPTNSNSGADNSGKLTLKKLSFSYDRSQKSRQSNYSFSYNNEGDKKFGYDESKVDVWGSFKCDATMRALYSEQKKKKADLESAAWLLNKVTTPAGSHLQVEYESKDYAFVQDKQAMQMFRIVNFRDNAGSLTSKLFEKGDATHMATHYTDLVVDLGRPVADHPDVLYRYFHLGEKLYINCLVSVAGEGPIDSEEISGYFDVAGNIRPFGNSEPNFIVIPLKKVNGANPVARAFWQKLKKSMPDVLYPAAQVTADDPIGSALGLIKQVPKVLGTLLEFLDGYEGTMIAQGRAQKLDLSVPGYVRLYNPDGKKRGGGSRVKSIKMYDNWEEMTGDATLTPAVYGQEYFYSQPKPGSPKEFISSGVATYEPIGNDENPFIVSTGEFENSNALAPELYYYKTEPFGESFFPAPSIGYSRVKVRNLQYVGVTKNATGFELHEFYTAKDFPTITRRTDKQAALQRNGFFNLSTKYACSQGFSIEVNNMHGKVRATKFFSQFDSLTAITGTEYRYRTKDGQLNNEVNTIDPASGKIFQTSVGLTFDFNVTTSESSSYTEDPTMQFNLDVIPIIFGIPFPVFTYWPLTTSNFHRYRGVTTTKVIYRTGLIDEIIHFDNGAILTSKNELYDGRTGAVVVSSSQNEFNERIYTTTTPAYWFHEGMGPSSTNAGQWVNISAVPGNALFSGGEELLLYGHGIDGRLRAWLFKNSLGQTKIIDESGSPRNLTNVSKVKIIRSGFRNMQALPADEIMTASDPVVDGHLKFTDVIDASSVEYSQRWQTYMGLHPKLKTLACQCTGDKSILNWLGDFNLNIGADGTIVGKNAGIKGSLITVRREKCSVLMHLDKGIGLHPGDRSTVYPLRLSFSNVIPAVAPDECKVSFDAIGFYTLTDKKGKLIQKGIFKAESGCGSIVNCKSAVQVPVIDKTQCAVVGGEPVNPYTLGILGNWRQQATFKYVTGRKYHPDSAQNRQGFFEKFTLRRSASAGFIFGTPVKSEGWAAASQIYAHDPHGKALESADQANIRSSLVLGYGFYLPVAQAFNADHYEIGADNFEDYDPKNSVILPQAQCATPPHFKFDRVPSSLVTSSALTGITEDWSHTGRRSLYLAPSKTASLTRKMKEECDLPRSLPDYTADRYLLDKCDLLHSLTLKSGKEYMLSLWMREEKDIDHLDDPGRTAQIIFFSSGSEIDKHIFNPSGAIVDGWQKAEQVFKVPPHVDSIKITFSIAATKLWVDDVRVFPLNASMSTYVYDPVTLKLAAVLDSENFATLYEYDGEGQLTRVKKETERGIMTTQEVRSAKPKVSKLKFNP